MSWQWINLAADEYATPTEPPATAGLVYRRKRHALIGPPEAGKTLFALILGLEHKRGGHGNFGLIDFEMGEHATRLMLEELGATLDEIRAVPYVTPDGPPQEEDLAELGRAGVTLVTIDAAAGAYNVSGLDDNKRADAERFGRLWVEPLWRLEIATLLLDHVVKNTENRGRFAIGSERKLGTVDVALGLEAVKQLHRGGQGLVRITTQKDRPGHLPRPRAGELELASDPDTHRITWTFKPPSAEPAASNGFRPTVLMERVSRFVQEHEPVSMNATENGVTSKSRTWTRRAIEELLDDGYITESPGSRGARMLAHVRPFTTSPDLAPTSPGEVVATSPDFAHPLQGGEVVGEVDPAKSNGHHARRSRHPDTDLDELFGPDPDEPGPEPAPVSPASATDAGQDAARTREVAT